MSETRLYQAPGFASGLLLVYLMLVGAGIVMVFSATAFGGLESGVAGSASTAKLVAYAQHVVVALLALLLATFIPLRFVEAHCGKLFFAVGIVLMALVLVFGQNVNNSTRWITIGMRFQPGEFAKVAFCVWLAYNVGTKDDRLSASIKDGLVPNVAAGAILFVLFLLQPDLGSTIVLSVVMLALLYIGGSSKKSIAVVMAIFGSAGAAAIYFSDNRTERFLAWLAPEAYKDALGGAQLHQSVTTVASGGLFGRGLAQGPQNIAGSIPESHTDFIYSILTEEFGAVGSILLISAFIYLLYAGIKVSLRHTDKFKRYMGISLSLLIALHAGVHICVASGAFPTKGITLPFISWGGSSLVAMSAAVGLILNLSRGDGEVALVHEVTSEGGDAVYVRAEP